MFPCSCNIPSCRSRECLNVADKFYRQPRCGARWEATGSEEEQEVGYGARWLDVGNAITLAAYSPAGSWAQALSARECCHIYSQLRDRLKDDSSSKCSWHSANLFCFWFVWPHLMACRISIPWPGIEPMPCSQSAESYPLDCQRIPNTSHFWFSHIQYLIYQQTLNFLLSKHPSNHFLIFISFATSLFQATVIFHPDSCNSLLICILFSIFGPL